MNRLIDPSLPALREPESPARSAAEKALALKATVIIPIFNECEAIGATLRELFRRGVQLDHEIIVVDDGSTDGSAKVVAAFGGVRLIRHATNRGYGAALKSGIRQARSEKVIFMDGDGQHSSEAVDEIERLLDTHAMVIGERGADSRQHRSRLVGKRMIRILGEYLLGTTLPDFNSGFRGFRRSALLPILGLLPSGFSFSTTSTLAFIKHDYEFATVPIHVAPRVGRPSTVRFFRDGFKTALLVLRMVMLFNPLKIFCPASLFFGVAGVTWGVLGAMLAGRVPNSAVLTVVLGMFLFFIGLLADQISLLHFRSHDSIHVQR